MKKIGATSKQAICGWGSTGPAVSNCALLQEWKAVAALLQYGLSPTEIEQSVSFANAVVLQRFMWKVQ